MQQIMTYGVTHIVRLTFICLLCLITFYANNTAAEEVQGLVIKDVHTTESVIRQGDRISLVVRVNTEKPWKNLTAEFTVTDENKLTVAVLESDFISIEAAGEETLRFEFRWADLDIQRSGNMQVSRTSLKQHNIEEKSASVVAESTKPIPLQVVAVTDPVERMYVSRENSLWWLTEMGRVDTETARKNNLANCVMFGGESESWIRNDYLSSEGSDALCYWEITGYALRILALEYERSGNQHYLSLAKDIADVISRNIRDDSLVPYPRGSLPTFNHYDGRIGEWYKDQAMIFDHGQVLMGLLEFARVMKVSGLPDDQRKPIENAALEIADFILRISKSNDHRIPSFWSHETQKTSLETEQSAKVIIGFSMLEEIMQDPIFPELAYRHLDEMLLGSPPKGEDYHGRLYMGYGFIRSFKDYSDDRYLKAADQWTTSVASEMDYAGRLISHDEYSVIPAQNQLIRNSALLWELTGEPEYLEWADRSANFLTSSSKAWTYRNPVLKLGRYFREAGGLYNAFTSSELCSWSSIFHIDAMYHYLRLKYGHVYVGPENTVSMIGPVKVTHLGDNVEFNLRGNPDDNIGIYIAGDRNISRVEVDQIPFAYHSKNSARLPPFAGEKKVVVHFGKNNSAHLQRTNSHVLNAELTKEKALHLKIRGRAGTTGNIEIFWPAGTPDITLDDQPLPGEQWQLHPDMKSLKISYPHNGKEQVIKITPRR